MPRARIFVIFQWNEICEVGVLRLRRIAHFVIDLAALSMTMLKELLMGTERT